MITKEAVLDALRTVQEPELGDDLVSLEMIRDVEIDGNKVRFTLVLTTSFSRWVWRFRNGARKRFVECQGCNM